MTRLKRTSATTLASLWLALIFCLVLPNEARAQSRGSLLLSSDWRFQRSDVPDAASADFDDSKWPRVTLPHTSNAGDGEQASYYRGPAWYRRTLNIAQMPSGRRLFLQFDGAATRADVYVNGAFIGRHDGAHSRFRFDITDRIRAGSNLLAVRVNNAPNDSITPLGGDFTLFGGLYRPVSIIEVDPLHFDLQHFSGPGIYARAAKLPNASSWAVAVDTRIANAAPRRQRTAVNLRVLDAGGREVARSSKQVSVPASGVLNSRFNLTLTKPRLWDGVLDPYLYRIAARLGTNGDQISVPLGVREFQFDPDRGFILNGRPYPIRGANLQHSARPGAGTAVTDEEIREDFAILREMGSTGVRLAHFQHPAAAYEEADRRGLVTWTEVGINGMVENSPEFRANARQQLQELIFQTYNHPSIAMWGLGNEVYSTHPHVRDILAELHTTARMADPSRPTVYAHCCQSEDDPKALVTDIIGFNKYFGWYPDQKGTVGEWAHRVRRAQPERAFGVSEFGAGGSILHQEDPPRQPETAGGWHPEQYQALFHERSWIDLKARPYLWGAFIWVAFDFASAGRSEGDRPGINDKGLVTYDRKTRKDAFYWYRANWSKEPTLHLTGRRFKVRRTPDVEVKAYSNIGAATLLLNGQPVGAGVEQDHILRWGVRLRPGRNVISVRSANGLYTDTAEWLFDPAPVAVTLER